MKRTIFALLAALCILGAGAQESTESAPAWVRNMRLSGYGMLQYQAHDKPAASQSTFGLRLARLALDGKLSSDLTYKVQMQINGNTADTDADGRRNTATIRLVDLFVSWQRYPAFQLKAGQFKRPFTFENPMHPITQGFMSYSQVVSKLAGFSDRTGEQPSNGRDIGVQLQGDLLPAGGLRRLHYQIGIFNGEGINVSDRDNRKDVIGGLWVVPVGGMRLGAFAWDGSRAGIGHKRRYALSADFVRRGWTLRSEYIYSQGAGADAAAGDKADGFYALLIAPFGKGEKLHGKARYDLYRPSAQWDTARTLYEVGFDYALAPNLLLNMEYARVRENSAGIGYNLIDVEMDFRF